MDGFIVLPPFGKLLIEGKKTWELREKAPPSSKIGQRICLLSDGYALGIIEITGYKGPLTRKELSENKKKHLSTVGDSWQKYRYAWEIKVVERFQRPKKYNHPIGARVWIRNVAILEQMTQWMDN